MQQLLGLKKQYKEATGKDWAPSKEAPTTEKDTGVQVKQGNKKGNKGKGGESMPGVAGKADPESAEALALKAEVDTQGNKVRQLKSSSNNKVGN